MFPGSPVVRSAFLSTFCQNVYNVWIGKALLMLLLFIRSLSSHCSFCGPICFLFAISMGLYAPEMVSPLRGKFRFATMENADTGFFGNHDFILCLFRFFRPSTAASNEVPTTTFRIFVTGYRVCQKKRNRFEKF